MFLAKDKVVMILIFVFLPGANHGLQLTGPSSVQVGLAAVDAARLDGERHQVEPL